MSAETTRRPDGAPTPASNAATAARRARQAYELAMLRVAIVRAALVAGLVATLSLVGATKAPPAAWLAVGAVAWVVVGWRGALLWRGALAGLVAGLGALALPMSLLRPCCSPAAMAAASSCSMPVVCVAAGGVLGVLAAATLPRLRSPGEWARSAAGALVGATSLLACRCTTLLLGETLGLLAGLLATSAGVAAARARWGGRAAAR